VSSHQVLRLRRGFDLGYDEVGDPAGQAVIAFHGTPGSRLQVAQQISDQPARDAGVRLIAIDRPGYGASSFQPNRRLTDVALDVAELADHLELEQFTVVGISGGGPHALACGALLGDRVRRLAIVSGLGPARQKSSTRQMMATNRLLFALARRRTWLARPVAAAMATTLRRAPVPTLKAMLRQMPPRDVAVLSTPEILAAFADDARQSPRTLGRAIAQDVGLFTREWGFSLDAIRVPVDLFHGDADVNVPPHHVDVLAAGLPQATVHRYPGEGHLLVVDRLGEIIAAVTAPPPETPTRQ